MGFVAAPRSLYFLLAYSCDDIAFSLAWPFSFAFLSSYGTILGMSELVKERPADPVEWLAAYLLRNNPTTSRQTHAGALSGVAPPAAR